jgi:hypothetical protein
LQVVIGKGTGGGADEEKEESFFHREKVVGSTSMPAFGSAPSGNVHPALHDLYSPPRPGSPL